MDARYSCEDDTNRWKVLRDWEYTMVGILGTVFEKVEKKKVLHQRSQEVQIKGTIETLQAVIKLLTKSIHLHNEDGNEYMKQLQSVYLNGSVHDFISISYTMLQLGLIRIPSNAKV